MIRAGQAGKAEMLVPVLPFDGWHRSDFPSPAPANLETTLARSLGRVAARWPNAAALIDRGNVVTFRDLVERIGGLAAQITESDAPAGPVALLQSISTDAIAAWFACTLAGRPFLMLELASPPERNRALMERAGVRILLTNQPADQSLVAGLAPPTVLVPDNRRAAMKPLEGLQADQPAIIFPTSGSTGEPKQIVYSARTLQAKVQASIPIMGIKPGDRVLIAGSHNNFGYLHHALVFLLSGGSVALADVRADGLTAVFDAILNHGVRHVRFTPSLFRIVAAQPASAAAMQCLDAIRFSGEPLLTADLDLAHQILRKDCRLQNVYGSTESALFVWTDDRGAAPAAGTVPIGRIYPLWEFIIEDDDGTPVAPGELGELVISSRNQALGDWTGSAIDQSRFPPDPRGNGARLYHTGDIVRLGEDGYIAIAGRKDRLVKINGLRVSLDEIESHLQAMPGCSQVAVIERPGDGGGNRLVAFLVGEDGAAARLDPAEWLAQRLPRHMRPARFQWIEAMPLLPGGKTDRKALQASLPTETLAPVAVPRTGDPMADLAAIWRHILNLPDFAHDADFFSLGGDSLLFMELQLAVEHRFGKAVPVDPFLEKPTLRVLARLLGLAPPDSPRLLAAGEVEVNFRLVRRAEGTACGVAMCMPGLGGSSAAERLAQSHLFTEFDLWACDARSDHGTLMRHDQWVAAAEAAAQRINAGTVPTPDLMVGFSLGGCTSWLTARLLSTSTHRPKRLITIDAVPVHQISQYRSDRLKRLLAKANGAPYEILELHRAIPEPFRFDRHGLLRWTAEDGQVARLGMRTLEHLDMAKSQTLNRVATTVNHFAREGLTAPLIAAPISGLETIGGEACDLLQRPLAPDAAAIVDAMLAKPETLSGRNALAGLLFLALIHMERRKALALAEHVVALYPEFHFARYACLRLSRMKGEARPTPNASASLPNVVAVRSFAGIDLALSLRNSGENTDAATRMWMRSTALSGVVTPRAAKHARRLMRRLGRAARSFTRK